MSKKPMIQGLEFTYKGGKGSGHQGHTGGAGGEGNPGGSIAGTGSSGRGASASSKPSERDTKKPKPISAPEVTLSKAGEVKHIANDPKRTAALLKECGLENLEGLKIEVHSYTSNVQDALGGLENMPPEVVKRVAAAGGSLAFGEGNFTDFEDQRWIKSHYAEQREKGEIMPAEGMGVYKPSTNKAYIGTMTGREWEGREEARRTASHEFGHAVDYSFKSGTQLSNSSQFKTVYEKSKSKLTPYELTPGGEGREEAFATRFGAYFESSSSNSMLFNDFPEIHSYMKKQFGEGP